MASARNAGSAGPIILCYDGSPQAAEAISYAGRLVPGRRAIVVVVWKRIIEEALATPMSPPVTDPVDVNRRERESAEAAAEDGAELATEAGLEAEAVVIEADGPRWHAIEVVAEERDAGLVVCGTRHSGVTAALPQSLAGALAARASRPVLVVPSPQAAGDRRRDAERESAGHHIAARAVARVTGRGRHDAVASRSPRR